MIDPFAGDDRPPRRWQVECYPLAMEAIRSRVKGVIHACTGSGKTREQIAILRTVFATMRPGYRIVVLAPKQALVEQTVEAARAVLGKRAVGPWYGRSKVDAPIIVACNDSLETLADHLDQNGLRVALLMVDECHRANSEAIRALIEERIKPWTRIGLTATPFTRVENEALVGWDRIVYSYHIDDAIAEGVLVGYRPVIWRGDEDTDATEATIQMIREHAPVGPGLVSARDKDDAEAAAIALTAAGIPALEVHTIKMSKAERKRRIGLLLSGQIRCIVHIDLLTEGVDIPELRWLAMRRPRNSHVAIVQEVGRILRTLRADHPDLTTYGPKTEAVVLLPHLTPVVAAIGRQAALAADAVELARMMREAAEREVDQHAEYVMPPAVSVGDVTGWLTGLVEAARGQGVELEPHDERGPWRELAPTSKQIEAIRNLTDDPVRSPIRYLPSDHRDSMRAVIGRPEVLTRGSATELVGLLWALRRTAAKHIAANAHAPQNRRYWRGLEARPGLPEPPAFGG